jgi:hypothetical protein
MTAELGSTDTTKSALPVTSHAVAEGNTAAQLTVTAVGATGYTCSCCSWGCSTYVQLSVNGSAVAQSNYVYSDNSPAWNFQVSGVGPCAFKLDHCARLHNLSELLSPLRVIVIEDLPSSRSFLNRYFTVFACVLMSRPLRDVLQCAAVPKPSVRQWTRRGECSSLRIS